MPTPIRIVVGDKVLDAELNDTETAKLIAEALPIAATGATWGDEIYFGIPVDADEEPGAKQSVAVGDLGYWPPGTSFCIFYGKTPISTSTEILAASPVNIIGHLTSDPAQLKGTRSGVAARVEKA